MGIYFNGQCIINHCKDPYQTASMMESKMVFFVAERSIGLSLNGHRLKAIPLVALSRGIPRLGEDCCHGRVVALCGR